MTKNQRLWRVFALILAVELAVTALFCALMIPDFERIAAWRVDTTASSVMADVSGEQLLYLPQAAGAPLVSINGGAARAPQRHDAARLTRRLQFMTMDVPGGTTLNLAQPPRYAGAPYGPAYLGPRVAIQPIVDQHHRWGGLMQVAIPAAGFVALIISLLLVFFSRRPIKYMLLIAAFTIQLVIELEINPQMFGRPLSEYSQFMGILTHLCIWGAVAIWTGAPNHLRRFVLTSGIGLLVTVSAAQFIGTGSQYFVNQAISMLFVFWLLILQVINWRMILKADFISGFWHGGALASFIIATSGALAHALVGATGGQAGPVFFLSNWTNVATVFGLMIFVVGALTNEVQSYRAERATVRDLRLVAAGHHEELSGQQRALRLEIERNAVLEERQRFVRDLHDGIGNQLLGLMIKLRGHGDAAPLASDVQAVIADLRLVATALDGPEGDLTHSLATLRERLEVQAAGVGVTLSWQADVQATGLWPQRFILDMLRIIQECVGNALRHAEAKAIAVTISGGAELVIIVEDDGHGFDPTAVRAGHGLRNIAARAGATGGHVNIERSTGEGGTRVAVTLVKPAEPTQ